MTQNVLVSDVQDYKTAGLPRFVELILTLDEIRYVTLSRDFRITSVKNVFTSMKHRLQVWFC